MLVTSLASSSKGNATLIRSARAAVLVDCGLACRTIEPLLCAAGVRPEQVQAIFLTHEHGDHVQGVGTLARKHRIPVICTAGTAHALREKHLRDLTPQTICAGDTMQLADLDVTGFAVAHDAAEPLGFMLHSAGVTVGLATDLGRWNTALVEQLRPADLLVIEANHSREQLLASSYPWSVCQRIIGPYGHLDNSEAGALLAAIGSDGRARDVRLAHLSDQANTAAYAVKTVRGVLAAAGVSWLRVRAFPRIGSPYPHKLHTWSSDQLLQQSPLF